MDIIKLKEQIVQACTSNSIATVISLLSQQQQQQQHDDTTTLLLNEPMSWFDSDGMEQMTPPLFIAIDYGHVDLVREMVTIFYVNNNNSEEHHHDEDDDILLDRMLGGDGEYTPLQWASSLGHLQIVKILIEEGNATADSESLSMAQDENHTNVADYLKQHVNVYADFEHLHDDGSYETADSSNRSGGGASSITGLDKNTTKDIQQDDTTLTAAKQKPSAVSNIVSSTHNDNHMIFSLPSLPSNDDADLQITLHQVSTADKNQGNAETNTGFIMWPSAVMLSHHLTQNPGIVLGTNSDGDVDTNSPEGNVLELGSGCGLAGLTAATLLENDGSTDKVIFTDYNPSVLNNLRKNVELNKFDVDHQVCGLDWFDQQKQQSQENQESLEGKSTTAGYTGSTSTDDNQEERKSSNNTWVDMDGIEHAQTRLIIGSDLIVCSNDADLVASTIDCALIEGGKAIILGADSSKRFGVRGFADSCRLLGLDVEVDENIWSSTEVEGNEQHLKQGLEYGGYNQRASTFGHDFTMFTINKPITTSVV